MITPSVHLTHLTTLQPGDTIYIEVNLLPKDQQFSTLYLDTMSFQGGLLVKRRLVQAKLVEYKNEGNWHGEWCPKMVCSIGLQHYVIYDINTVYTEKNSGLEVTIELDLQTHDTLKETAARLKTTIPDVAKRLLDIAIMQVTSMNVMVSLMGEEADNEQG